MKIILRVLAIIFGLAVIGSLIGGKLFLGGILFGGICAYFGWRAKKTVDN